MRYDQVFLVACYVYMCRIIVYVVSTYLIIHRCFVPPSEEFASFVAITSLIVLLLAISRLWLVGSVELNHIDTLLRTDDNPVYHDLGIESNSPLRVYQ